MEEKQLLIISIIIVSLGISSLYFIFLNQDLDEVNNIETHLEEDVKIIGKVKKINQINGLTFLEVERTRNDLVLFFDEVDVLVNDNIEVIGEVEKYKGKYEILGKKIKIYKP